MPNYLPRYLPSYLLDTDHLSLLQRKDARVAARLLTIPRQDRAAAVISYEEQMRGWLAKLNRQQTPEQICEAYSLLCNMQRFYCSLQLIEFDRNCLAIFERLRKIHRRTKTMDLRIAATALALGATLVTRNTQDFIDIENLQLENWA